MGNRFDDRFLEQVASANDIVEYIGTCIPLKKSGKSFSALCPFHKEKTPSFHVFPEDQRFKCFGCNKGGSIFHFAMEYNRLSFPEAVEMLARRAGIEIDKSRGGTGEGKSLRDLSYRLNSSAQEFFRAKFLASEGRVAREYLAGRGISSTSAETFGLGYSPDGWQALIEFLAARGIDEAQLLECGLASKSDERGRVYDRFRNRLMFPIRDLQGRIAGFGARTLGDDKPKYLNSPETAAYSKSQLLYGLYEGKDEVAAKKRAVIVEGYTDVIAAHAAGVKIACATLGTALAKSHLDILRRYADEVVLLYDGDSAGVKAAERSLPLFLSDNMSAKVVILPEGKDPFDFIKSDGKEAFRAALDSAVPLYRFFLDGLAQAYDLSDPNGKLRAAERAAAIIASCENELNRDVWTAEAAAFLGIPTESLARATKQKATRPRFSQPDTTQPVLTEEKPSAAELMVIGSLLSVPKLFDSFSERLAAATFPTPRVAALMVRFFELQQEELEWDTLFRKTCEDPADFALAESARANAPKEAQLASEVIERALADLERSDLRNRVRLLKKKILEAHEESDEWAMESLTHELEDLQRRLKR
ncbi:MAG: DNA primase [Candidatus Brocadiia bacterium]